MVLVVSIDISAGCDDIESQLCSDLIEKYPGFCSDSCLSQICQRSCGSCGKLNTIKKYKHINNLTGKNDAQFFKNDLVLFKVSHIRENMD